MIILTENRVTNNHLKNVVKDVSNFMNNSTEVPDDMMVDLLAELMVSNLIMPAEVEGEFVHFKNLTLDEGVDVIGLFTDTDEFLKFTRDYTPLSNPFPFYVNMVKSNGLGGIIINPGSDDFFIDPKLISSISYPTRPKEKGEGLNGEELKWLSETLTNDALVAFIRERSNLRNYEEALPLIESSTLLNAVSNRDNIGVLAKDGIIKSEDVGGFGLSVVKSGFEKYVALFTSKSAIADTCEENEYLYQVCNLDKVLEFVLANDMSGAVINPGLEEYFIPRNALLRLFLNANLYDSDLIHAVDYAFVL